MNRFKRILSIAAIGMLTLSTGGCIVKTQEGKDNTVVGKVGNVKIVVADVKKEMKSTIDAIISQYGPNYKTNDQAISSLKSQYESVLTGLADKKLLYLVAQDMKQVPDKNDIEGEVQKQVDLIKQTQFENDQAKLDAALAANGLTLDSWKDSIREELKDDPESSAATRVKLLTAKDATATDDEIKKYYDTNIEQYTTQPGANYFHIVVDTEDKAKDIKSQLDKGAKFEDLAKQDSTDKDTKDSGGALGYLNYTNTAKDKDFLAAGQKLADGEVSQPVKVGTAWEIIKVTGVQKEAKVTPLDSVKDSIKSEIVAQNQSKKYSESMDKWKKEKGYKIDVAKLLKNVL